MTQSLGKDFMNSLLHYLEKISFTWISLIAVITTLIIGIADFLIGPELSTTLFYVLPIAFGTWYGSRSLGIFLSILCAVVWFITDIRSGRLYSHEAVLFWNTIMRLGIFVLLTLLLAAFRNLLHKEQLAADTDHLTGVYNSRGFNEKFEMEYARCVRFNRPFSIAYIDIDDFKTVNDALGHNTGDNLLTSVAGTLKDNLRKTDVVARLGGDEFVILFSETDADAVKEAFYLTYNRLMEVIHTNRWPVTFSVGVVTFQTAPESIKFALAAADELMYSVKKSTKNSIRYVTWGRAA